MTKTTLRKLLPQGGAAVADAYPWDNGLAPRTMDNLCYLQVVAQGTGAHLGSVNDVLSLTNDLFPHVTVELSDWDKGWFYNLLYAFVSRFDNHGWESARELLDREFDINWARGHAYAMMMWSYDPNVLERAFRATTEAIQKLTSVFADIIKAFNELLSSKKEDPDGGAYSDQPDGRRAPAGESQDRILFRIDEQGTLSCLEETRHGSATLRYIRVETESTRGAPGAPAVGGREARDAYREVVVAA